jgi:hypothetical protein
MMARSRRAAVAERRALPDRLRLPLNPLIKIRMDPQRITDAPALWEMMDSPNCGKIDLDALGM